ncbi:unnamed protein product [Adineta ricciae]|uniref:F-box domain-containing protein n=1 Tax=Adineta ricciae TaxID=249248 RepID=A0A814UK46_ADIRI|nr:unnamed protein product [Adineta ricciae]
MLACLEHFPNELLLHVFRYTDTRDLFHGFYGLNQRFVSLLKSLQNRSLIIEKNESKLICVFHCQIHKLVVDTCLNVDFRQFPHLKSLILCDLTENHLSQIRSKLMPNLTYLSVASTNTSWYLTDLLSCIFSDELPSLTTVQLQNPIPVYSNISFNISLSLRSIAVCCRSSYTILNILSCCPNLRKLQMVVNENQVVLFYNTTIVSNYSVKTFILSDVYSMIDSNDIIKLLEYMPNIERLRLSFTCSVPFIDFARIVIDRSPHLDKFDCHIEMSTDDDMTCIESIHQLHPALKRITFTSDEIGYRTYSTD